MSKMVPGVIIMVGLAGLLAGASAKAQDAAHLEERKHLLSLIADVNADADKRKSAVRKGSQRASFCANCHGKDGNSQRPEIPNLAGQNPSYLLEQFDMFADGRRKNFVMEALAKDFTMEDKVNISIFFSKQEVILDQGIDYSKAGRGKEIFGNVCQFCHGPDGKGEAGYARLAGQQKEYMVTALKRYRENAKAKPNPDEVKRTNARMEQVTKDLTDGDIEALANYIASIK